MLIDWNNFTPLPGLAGGAMLGLAAAMFALWNGRIAGISGIVGGLLRPQRGDLAWRLAFVAGLLLAPVVYRVVLPLPTVTVDAGWGSLILAGLLVGLGSRYGAGCTSGHGICGLARLSPRSLAATLLFMSSGFAMTFVVRHVLA